MTDHKLALEEAKKDTGWLVKVGHDRKRYFERRVGSETFVIPLETNLDQSVMWLLDRMEGK